VARSTACVDTDVCIEFLRGRSPGDTHFERALTEYDLRVTALTAYELLLGQRRMRRQQDLAGLFQIVPVIPFGERAAEESATIQAILLSRGQGIGLPDTLIAGTCLAESIPLITYNLAHFERVLGLQVIDPTAL